MKNVDEDSRLYLNDAENRGWWEPDTSRIYLNITSELQFLKGGKLNRVKAAGIRPLQRRHMIVCLGGL